MFTRNAFDIAHGGALTTYVDISTTAAIYAFDGKERTQVSAQLDMQFFNPALLQPEGAHPLQIEARVNKIGKTLAFTKADLIDLSTKQLICSGSHIKAFVDREWKLIDV